MTLAHLAQKTKVEQIGFLGSFLSVFAVTLSAILYYRAESFTFFDHWVSNLGVGSSPSAYLFNVGLKVSAVFYFTFNLYLLNWMHPTRNSVKIIMGFATLFNIIAAIGIFVLTSYNMIDNLPYHSVGAVSFFGFSAAYIFFVYIALYLSKCATKTQFLLTMIILVSYISLTPLMMISLPPSEWPTMLGYMGPELNNARFLEWICLGLFYTFLVQTSRLVTEFRKNESTAVLSMK